ncbi:PEP-CTERM sorting domain-containing protein [Viridibacterium curvum]|uniref:Ice-binding protein C-terminal domain-containing protein n=1 Tax=Viridibacterium curvum TaxID=1101404 RepID=A0ABP9QYP4_9RHOO
MIKKIALACAVSFAAAAHAAPVTFNFIYQDAAGVGFNDATLGAQRKAALQLAGQTWGDMLVASYAGETINIAVSFNTASTSSSPVAGASTVGSVYANAGLDNKGNINTVYTAPLAEHLAGRNLNGSSADYTLTFSPNVPTYLGLDGQPGAGQFDFETYAQRGIAQVLGYAGNSRIYRGATTHADGAVKGGFYRAYDPATNSYPRYAGIYDTFVVDGNGTSLLAMTDAQRATALTSGSLYWTGANAVAANGGALVKLSVLAPNADGSIASNTLTTLDGSLNSLMSFPAYAGVSRPIDGLTVGMLKDMGWNIAAVPEPSTYAMLFAGLGIIGLTARRRLQS